jgi:hypothetical protein
MKKIVQGLSIAVFLLFYSVNCPTFSPHGDGADLLCRICADNCRAVPSVLPDPRLAVRIGHDLPTADFFHAPSLF